MGGKIPIRGGWSKLGHRPWAEVRAQYQAGYNLSILTGVQPGAPTSLVAVDGDSAEAVAWMRAHLPPTPLRSVTRRGEHWYYRIVAGAVDVASINFRYAPRPQEMELLGNRRQVVAPGSRHRSGHVYREAEPWTAAAVAAAPELDATWFAPLGQRRPDGLWDALGEPQADGGDGGTGGTRQRLLARTGAHAEGDGWPGSRTFTIEELSAARERALSYLAVCPVSVSGSGGDATLHETAIKLLRGFPLASVPRLAELRAIEEAGGATRHKVDRQDALLEAAMMLDAVWDPRCVDNDGETPYPWGLDRLAYKVGEASRADRLPGPDFWLFDTPRANAGGSGVGAWLAAGNSASTPVPEVMGAGSGVDAGAGSVVGGSTVREVRDEGTSDEERLPGRAAFAPMADPEVIDSVDEVRIKIDHDTERMSREAIRAMARMESIYVRQHCLVDVVEAAGLDRYGMTRRPWVRKTSKAYLKSRMNSEVFWYSGLDDAGEEKRTRADVEAVSAILAAGAWPGVPNLEGIVYTPIVRGDGTILQIAGYDVATRLIYRPEVDHGEIRSAPTREQVEKARDFLLGVVTDFPFERPTVARSVWLSAVLTRFCRFSYAGMSPMFAVSAAETSSGKTLVVDSAAIIADGRTADTMPFIVDEAEQKREILALLSRDDVHHINLDNIARGTALSSSAYEAMLTGQATVGREVGTSDVKRIVMSDAVWWATGNGLEIGADMARRTLKIDILDLTGKPRERRVRHGDLRAYCKETRGTLVRAALTILAGFAAAGGPQATVDCDGAPVKDFPSFEAWARVVRQAVIWAGLPDPCRALASADEQAAPEANRSAHLIELWLGAFGSAPVQSSEAARRLLKEPARYCDLVNYLSDHGLERITPVGLGKFLVANIRGIAVIDGQRRIMHRHEVAKGVFWSVKNA